MVQSAPASEIAALILRGFDDYREQFREITDGARARFEQAQWQEAQRASAQRINLYEEKVAETVAGLRAGWPTASCWTWSAGRSSRAPTSRRSTCGWTTSWPRPGSTRSSAGCSATTTSATARCSCTPPGPSLRAHARAPYTRTYRPGGDLRQALEKIFDDYRFDVPYDDRERDLERIDALLHSNLPDCAGPGPGHRADRLGVLSQQGRLPGGPPVHPGRAVAAGVPAAAPRGHGIQFDTVITDEAEVSIIFSFTRSYFMVDVPVPAELVAFLKRLLPGKHLAELYTSIGFYKQGKSEFYRARSTTWRPPTTASSWPRRARHGDERVHPARLQHGVQDHQGPLQPVEERRPRHGDPEVPVGEEPRPGRTPGRHPAVRRLLPQ